MVQKSIIEKEEREEKNCIGQVVDIKTSNNKMQLETLSYLFAIYCSNACF